MCVNPRYQSGPQEGKKSAERVAWYYSDFRLYSTIDCGKRGYSCAGLLSVQNWHCSTKLAVKAPNLTVRPLLVTFHRNRSDQSGHRRAEMYNKPFSPD